MLGRHGLAGFTFGCAHCVVHQQTDNNKFLYLMIQN